MKTTVKTLRRGLYTAFAVSAGGGALVAALAVPSATAAPDPCAASEVAKTIGSVATSTGEYLDANPETNQVLTTLSKQEAGPQTLGALKGYFDANPDVAEDFQELQRPLVNLSGRCKLPITAPQLMGLMQAAQGQGDALPGTLPNAQNVSVPAAASPAQSAPAATVSTDARGVGPRPGPAPPGPAR